MPVIADVSSQESLAKAAAEVRAKEGIVDVLVVNSGISGPVHRGLFPVRETTTIEEIQSRLWDIPMDAWTQTMHVNVTGAFYTVVAFLDLLDAANHRPATATAPPRPKSQVILISSIAGFSRVASSGFSYSASKAAVTHMTKQLSTSFAPYKIRFNGVSPGIYPSEMTVNNPVMKTPKDPRVEGNVPAKVCPLERTGTESDISGLILFLASPAGAYLNGCIEVTDGGRLAQMPSDY